MTAAGDDPTASSGAAPAGDEYSATVLGSQWIQRPEPDTTLVEPPPAADPRTLLDPGAHPEPTTPMGNGDPWEPTTPADPRSPRQPHAPAGAYGDVPPDRVEGTVMRFGPGVTAALTHRSHLTLPAMRQQAPRRRRGVRRHALPLLVLIVVVALLAWQRSATGPGLADVTVSTRQTALECAETADLVGVITTDGRPGTVSYRWVRSDGTTSGVLREVLSRGQKRARIHLLWTFEGRGTYEATATLRVLTPEARTAAVRFTYDCS